MAAFETERVLSVHRWNESLFTFTCTPPPSLRDEVLIGRVPTGRLVLLNLLPGRHPK